TEATTTLWDKVMEGVKLENRTHAPVDFDTAVASTITSHDAGYINKALEKVVGLQTEAPLKRALIPFGGIKMIEGSCKAYNRELDPMIKKIFTEYRKTHNQGVFDVYTPDILRCRKSGVLTGLPDAYGRGRIIGDYRRVALYGIDYLMKDKYAQFTSLQADLENGVNLEQTIRLREEIAEQHRALGQMKEMAAKYGYDISGPATNAQEAIQWTYFGYLAAVKSQNGAAMSFGRTSTFLDVYIERDLKAGKITEQEAQEMVDHLVMKLRMVRFLRTPEYDELFSGDPIWATESIGGMGLDGRTLVTKNSFRFLNTLYTMGPSPEPNMTILWSEKLPLNFKKFAAKVSIDTSSLQYENDDLMRPDFNNDDYAIACCVSPMIVGKQMQFFGARANLAKTMLYAINGGVDEKLKMQVGPKSEPIKGDLLNYDEVMERMDHFMDWLAKQYITALNIIHYMHDKYSYEASLMALHDRDVIRTMACGIAGLSVAADSLSAIKYAKVKPIRDEDGLAIDFEIEGEYPQFGNNDPRVDDLAVDLVERFMKKIQKLHTYRDAIPTQSVLTITSNVVYGKKTGNVVIDPNQDDQPALRRAVYLHQRIGGKIKAFLPIYDFSYEMTTLLSPDERTAMRQGVISQRTAWIHEQAKYYLNAGVPIEIKVVWHNRPFEAIIQEVISGGHDLVLKMAHQHDRLEAVIFTPTDWHLLRKCPSPVWMVKDQPWPEGGKALVAVNLASEEPYHNALNEKLVKETIELAEQVNHTEVHLVGAYPVTPINIAIELPEFDPSVYNDAIRGQHLLAMKALRQKFGINENMTHVEKGLPEEVIPDLAEHLQAGIVVLGTVGRTGISAAFLGNTAEQVIDHLRCDLLVIKPDQYQTPVELDDEEDD
ncbi:formate C-acetyltransferase, partial [Escherichia coli]